MERFSVAWSSANKMPSHRIGQAQEIPFDLCLGRLFATRVQQPSAICLQTRSSRRIAVHALPFRSFQYQYLALAARQVHGLAGFLADISADISLALVFVVLMLICKSFGAPGRA